MRRHHIRSAHYGITAVHNVIQTESRSGFSHPQTNVFSKLPPYELLIVSGMQHMPVLQASSRWAAISKYRDVNQMVSFVGLLLSIYLHITWILIPSISSNASGAIKPFNCLCHRRRTIDHKHIQRFNCWVYIVRQEKIRKPGRSNQESHCGSWNHCPKTASEG